VLSGTTALRAAIPGHPRGATGNARSLGAAEPGPICSPAIGSSQKVESPSRTRNTNEYSRRRTSLATGSDHQISCGAVLTRGNGHARVSEAKDRYVAGSLCHCGVRGGMVAMGAGLARTGIAPARTLCSRGTACCESACGCDAASPDSQSGTAGRHQGERRGCFIRRGGTRWFGDQPASCERTRGSDASCDGCGAVVEV